MSWGEDCGNFEKPGVYTRISSLMKWIQRNTVTEDMAAIWDSNCDIVTAPDDDGKAKIIHI